MQHRKAVLFCAIFRLRVESAGNNLPALKVQVLKLIKINVKCSLSAGHFFIVRLFFAGLFAGEFHMVSPSAPWMEP